RSDFYPRKGQGVFRHGKRFCSIQNTPCYFLTKIEIRHGRIGVSVERQALPFTSPVLHLCPLRFVTPLQSNGDL
ncbi:hypothetical protein ACIXBR_23105, partial [Bacteroides fragilis]